MTEAGRDFYESASRILDDFESATSQIGRGQTSPKGLIRVTVPPTFARLHMVSKLPAFFAAYPEPRRETLGSTRMFLERDFSSTTGFPRAPSACSPKLALELVLRY
jgi:DNA-binding transcriptional LysR family regulator